ncbi:hypothetical protein Esti_004517 [Eimeria stiedai]
MAPPPVKVCSGSSLLSLSSSPPSLTDAELLLLKAALASRRAGVFPGQAGGAPPSDGAPSPPSDPPSGPPPPTSSSAAERIRDGGGADAEGGVVLRAEAVEKEDSRFYLQPRKYQQQFAALYFGRLQQLRPHALQAAQTHWPGLRVLNAIKDAKPGEVCVVIGTMFKEMPSRPSVLNDYVNTLEIQTPVATQEAAEPRLFLEDMTARIALMPETPAAPAAATTAAAATATPAAALVAFGTEPGLGFRVCGEMDPYRCVTGLVVGVRGVALGTGVFQVKEICLPGVAPPGGLPPGEGPLGLPPLRPSEVEDMKCEGFDLSSKYVAFVSGLRLGSPSINPVSLQLLRDFLLGAAPSASLRRLSSLVVKLVVCGDCLSLPASASGGGIDRSQQVEASASLPAALEEADCYLAQLASCVSLFLMPGPLDPTTFALPQRPLHAALLPFTRQFASAKGAPNPHAFVIDEVRFIGSSGQPVDDICRNSSLSPMEALQLTAHGRCLAPTAPDSLACYPSINDDPFSISGSSSYHVYFAGLQKQHQQCRLVAAAATGGGAAAAGAAAPVCVCVPDFALRGELVLLSLKTFQSRTLRFWEAEGE